MRPQAERRRAKERRSLHLRLRYACEMREWRIEACNGRLCACRSASLGPRPAHTEAIARSNDRVPRSSEDIGRRRQTGWAAGLDPTRPPYEGGTENSAQGPAITTGQPRQG